jgi:hypothetical protein
VTSQVVVGLLAISAMWWLPALLGWLDRNHYQRPPNPPERHVTPTQVRIVRRPVLRPGRELDRWDR